MHTLSTAGSLYTQQAKPTVQDWTLRILSPARLGPRTYLDLSPVGLRFREAQSRLEGGGGGGRLAGTRDQRSGEQGTRQSQEAQQVHGGRTGSGEAGPLAGAGWGAGLRSCPCPSPAISFGGPPWASGSRGLRSSQLLPSDMAARAGERRRVSGTRLTGNRTSELPSVAAREVKRGRRGPAPPPADRGFVLAFCKEGEGGLVKPSHPEMFHWSRGARGSLVPLLPPLARSERNPAAGAAGEAVAAAAESGGGRRAAGRPAAARPASSRALEPPARAGPSGGGGGRRGRA